LRNAAGIVTINSTIGVTALHHGVPVKVLGNAVFDVAGLTCQSSLAAFWHDPQPPSPELMAAFLRALIGTTQVKGGYYERASQSYAIAGFVERLEQRLYPLPPLSEEDLAARQPRASAQTIVVAGLSEVGAPDAIGVALARSYAAPGVRLYLAGTVAATLEQTAEDCRHRGALVETFCLKRTSEPAFLDYLAALDRRTPVDTVVISAGATTGRIDRQSQLVERDISGAMRAADAIAKPMRRRGHGEIVLVSALARRPATGGLRLTRAFLAYGAALRRRSSADGVSVVVAAPGSLAIRAAAQLREPRLATVGADRIAALIIRALRRRRAVVVIPGLGMTAMRALRAVPSQLCDAARAVLLPAVDAIGEPADEGALSGKSGPGD
jgi:short-subunit dehydrogenase